MRSLARTLLFEVTFLVGALPLGAQVANPFDALERGARFSPSSRPRVGVWGQGRLDARADGSYELAAVPVGVPIRVVMRGRFSTAQILDGADSDGQGPVGVVTATVDLPVLTLAPGPLFELEVAGVGGSRTVTLGVGAQATVGLLAETISGQLLGGAEALIPAGAFDFVSSAPMVASVTAAGEVVAHRPGFAWVAVVGVGEIARVLVHVDGELDGDGDGAPDAWELEHNFDPTNSSDALRDADRDGISNGDEFELGTDPRRADTDGDGVDDGEEVARFGMDPLVADSDGDGRSDGLEVALGSDPVNPNDGSAGPFTPALIANRGLSVPGLRLATGADDTVFVIGDGGLLTSFRIDPVGSSVLFLDSVTLSVDSTSGAPVDIAAAGGRVYVTAGAVGFQVVDAADPTHLALEATVLTDASARGVVADGDRLYLATDGGLQVFTCDVGVVTPRGFLVTPPFLRLAVSGGLAFLGLPSSGDLLVADVTDPDSPIEIERVALPISGTPFLALAATGRTAYVAHGAAGLIAVFADVSGDLRVIDTALSEFGSASFGAVAVVGNRLVAETPATLATVQLFELADDGTFEAAGDVKANAAGAHQLVVGQNWVFALEASSFSVSEVLPAGDRAGLAPHGELLVEDPEESYARGSVVSARAHALDDVYLEKVEFLFEGRVLFSDSVPPFRTEFVLDPLTPVHTTVRLEARAFDLAGNGAALSRVDLVIESDLDGDGIVDSRDDDRDGDGIDNLEESLPGADGYVSDPDALDSDGDGVADREELTAGDDGFFTDPGRADSDGDGLSDGYETAELGTDPTLPDTDGNGVEDGDEDRDADGLRELLESLLGSNPLAADSDDDSLDDGIEYELGLDPSRADSDGDGVADGEEDSDEDGLSNRDEQGIGTDPAVADTDGDGLGDLEELRSGTDFLTPTDFSSRALTFTDQTVRLYKPITVASIRLTRSVLTVPASETGVFVPLALSVGRLVVDAGSRVDVSGRGYGGARTTGNATTLGLGPAEQPSGDPLTGGSHGGLGAVAVEGVGGDLVQPAFGSVVRPGAAGGGGSARSSGSGAGGSGGGVLWVFADSIALDGQLRADGQNGNDGGGGAGGSILIVCRSLTGRGTISADGGDGATSVADRPGGGGGGRVALYCSEDNRLDVASITAVGGTFRDDPSALQTAASGTILLETRGVSELRIDGGELSPGTAWTVLPDPLNGTIASLGAQTLERFEGHVPASGVGLALDPDVDDDRVERFDVAAIDGREVTINGAFGETALIGGAFGTVYSFDRLVLEGSARVRTTASIWLTGGGPLTASPDAELEARDVVLAGSEELTVTGRALRLRSLSTSGGALAELRLEHAVVALSESLDVGRCTVSSSLLELGAPLTCDTLELEDGATLTVSEPTVGIVYPLDVLVTGTFSIDTTSGVDLSGKGYVGGRRGGNPDARGVSADFSFSDSAEQGGGSHGGGGGGAQELGPQSALTYDSFASPQYPGAGGSARLASDETGANGGGLAVIKAGEVLLDGVISVKGGGQQGLSDDSAGGAGAGGAVLLRVETFRGAGTIDADGGRAAAGASSGAGGGGRVAILYGDRTRFLGSVTARGGGSGTAETSPANVGGAGTVFWRAKDVEQGDLVIDNGGRLHVGLRTVLRPVGAGTIDALAADSLTVSGDLVTQDTGHAGHWVILAEALETPFHIVKNTATKLTLAGVGDPRAVASVGDAYRGALFLRSLTVTGGAAVTTLEDTVLLRGGVLSVTADSQLDASVVQLEE